MNNSIVNQINKINYVYSELIETHDFIKSQNNDNLKSFEKLLNTININDYDNLIPIVECFKICWYNNKYDTVQFLKNNYLLGLSLFISGQCLVQCLDVKSVFIKYSTDQLPNYIVNINNVSNVVTPASNSTSPVSNVGNSNVVAPNSNVIAPNSNVYVPPRRFADSLEMTKKKAINKNIGMDKLGLFSFK
jgi:hypothetical protein